MALATSLNPNASSFKPRFSDGSKSLFSDNDYTNARAKIHHKDDSYLPNPTGNSGIMAFVNGRFSVVCRRDAQLLELLAPQKPFTVKDVCCYCYKRSPKSAKHNFKDQANRIICPLVGYKLAVLRVFRRGNPSYKEMRDLQRRVSSSRISTGAELKSHRRRSGSLSSASNVETSKEFGNKKHAAAMYEFEMQRLEIDYYKKLQGSEKEYSRKSNKEILEYMPISERIVSRLQQSASSSEDYDFEFQNTTTSSGNDGSDALFSKTAEVFKMPSIARFSSTHTFSDSKDFRKPSKRSSQLESSLESKNKMQSVYSRRLNNLEQPDLAALIRPFSSVGSDSKVQKSQRTKASKISSNKKLKVPTNSKTSRSSSPIEKLCSTDCASTSLSSVSSSASVFNTDSDSNGPSNSKRIKLSKETLVHERNSACHADDSEQPNSTSSDSNTKYTSSVDIYGNTTSISYTDESSIFSIESFSDANNNKLLCDDTDLHARNKILLSVDTVIYTNAYFTKTLKYVLLQRPDIFDGILNEIVLSFDLWTMYCSLLVKCSKIPSQKSIENAFFRKISHRKMSISSFLKHNLTNIDADISVTNCVVRILRRSGYLNLLACSTLHSVSFWKDVAEIYGKCYYNNERVNYIDSQFSKISSDLSNAPIGDFPSVFLTSVERMNVSHQCSLKSLPTADGGSKQSDPEMKNDLEADPLLLPIKESLCFKCVSNILWNKEIPNSKLSNDFYAQSLLPIITQVKVLLRKLCEGLFQELELLDFFFDNRTVILSAFRNNLSDDKRHTLLFDNDDTFGDIRVIINSGTINTNSSQGKETSSVFSLINIGSEFHKPWQ